MNRVNGSLAALGLALAVLGTLGARGLLGAHGAPILVVHEWGTITTRHAPNGTPDGRLNRISPREVLPAFVHQYEPPPAQEQGATHAAAQTQKRIPLVKSAITPGRPDVTMRLETPVLYFYPPNGSDMVTPFEVSVTFHGGVLNEFYPAASASVALDFDRINTKMRAGVIHEWAGDVLNNDVVGSLSWSSVLLKPTVPLPATSSPIWLAPRNVRSTGVMTPSGEGERYLFYRGVAHLDALVQTELSFDSLRLRAPQHLEWMTAAQTSIAIPKLWLVDIRADGSAAFREHQRIVITRTGESAELAALPLFAAKDYTATCLDDLRKSMKQSLKDAGLFDDEADAMLRTWNESYFQTPGLRVFYIVPREWIDYFLALRISVPAEVTRVLVGRIDLDSIPRTSR